MEDKVDLFWKRVHTEVSRFKKRPQTDSILHIYVSDESFHECVMLYWTKKGNLMSTYDNEIYERVKRFRGDGALTEFEADRDTNDIIDKNDGTYNDEETVSHLGIEKLDYNDNHHKRG
jgi:hypothetical protein